MDAEAPTISGRRELVPKEGASGHTESLTLLMCAASVGHHEALSTLLRRGPADGHFTRDLECSLLHSMLCAMEHATHMHG